MTDAHTLPSSGFGGGSHFKVDLAQIDVGADDGDHHLVAEAPGLAGRDCYTCVDISVESDIADCSAVKTSALILKLVD